MIKVLKDYFKNGEKASESITRSAFLIALMGLLSRLLGLVRDRVLASKFGAGDVLDAYYAAFRIPDLVYNLLVLGALSAAFLPMFSALISQDKKDEAWKLANTLLSVGSIFLLFLASLLFIFTPFLVFLMTLGYGNFDFSGANSIFKFWQSFWQTFSSWQITPKQEMIVQMTRWMLISPIFLGISGIFGGILNSFKKFFFYSLSPVFYNLGIIFGAWFLTDWIGYLGLSIGVVIGAFFHFSVQLPEVLRCGFKFSFSFDLKNRDFLKTVKLMLPRMAGLSVSQFNLLVITFLASTLPSGSLAIFNFANNLQSVPLGVFGISFAVAAYPALSGFWAKNDSEHFKAKLVETLEKIMFFVIPVSVLIFLLRAQIVRVALGAGQFDWRATVLTLNCLGIFTFSIWAQGAIPLFARSFYALCDTGTPFLIGIFSEAINLSLALWLIDKFELEGLIWAFSISSVINFILLVFFLRLKLGRFGLKKACIEILKIFLSAIFMGLVIQSLKDFIGAEPFGKENTFWGILTQFLVAFLVGGGAFFLMGRFLKMKNLEHFYSALKDRIFKFKKVPFEGVLEADGD